MHTYLLTFCVHKVQKPIKQFGVTDQRKPFDNIRNIKRVHLMCILLFSYYHTFCIVFVNVDQLE